MDAASVVAIIAAMASLIVGVITARSSASKLEMETVRATLRDLQDENRRLRELNIELVNRVSRLECENQEQRGKINGLSEENSNQKIKITNLEDENADLRERLDILEKRKPTK